MKIATVAYCEHLIEVLFAFTSFIDLFVANLRAHVKRLPIELICRINNQTMSHRALSMRVNGWLGLM